MSEATEEVIGVIVWVIRQGPERSELLFVRRSAGPYAGHWWPVTGIRKLDESSEAAARRELLEETSLESDKWMDTGIVVPDPSGVGGYPVFRVTVAVDAEVRLNHEHTEHRWVSFVEAVTMVPSFARRILARVEQLQ